MNRLLFDFVFQGYGNQLTDGQNNFLRFRRETDDFTVGVFGISELGNTEEVVFAVYQRYGQKGNRRVVIGIVEFGNQIGVYTGGLKMLGELMISRFNAQYSEGALRLRFLTSGRNTDGKKPYFRFR